MNARHIGDIAVTPSVFLYKLLIREGGLDLSHPPPPHSSNLSSTDFSADRQCLGGGLGSGGWATTPPPPATSWKGDRQSWGGGRMRVGG